MLSGRLMMALFSFPWDASMGTVWTEMGQPTATVTMEIGPDIQLNVMQARSKRFRYVMWDRGGRSRPSFLRLEGRLAENPAGRRLRPTRAKILTPPPGTAGAFTVFSGPKKDGQ